MELTQNSSRLKAEKILQSKPTNRTELKVLLNDVGDLLSEKLPIIIKDSTDGQTGALFGIAESLLSGLKMALRLKNIQVNPESKKSGIEWLLESIFSMLAESMSNAKADTIFNLGEALIEIGERVKGAVRNELESDKPKCE